MLFEWFNTPKEFLWFADFSLLGLSRPFMFPLMLVLIYLSLRKFSVDFEGENKLLTDFRCSLIFVLSLEWARFFFMGENIEFQTLFYGNNIKIK